MIAPLEGHRPPSENDGPRVVGGIRDPLHGHYEVDLEIASVLNEPDALESELGGRPLAPGKVVHVVGSSEQQVLNLLSADRLTGQRLDECAREVAGGEEFVFRAAD